MKNFKLTTNQNGLSSIMFAMIFSIVLSLLAVGFATLVRNDQRQTIDQSLSYQAQYAAETAVNQVQAAIKEGAITTEELDCQNFTLAGANSEVTIPCVTWTNLAPYIRYTDVTTAPRSFKADVASSFNKVEIKWKATNVGTYSSGSGLPDDISIGNYSIVKLALKELGSNNFRQHYLVPTGGGGSVNYNSAGSPGDAYQASCNATECTMTMNLPSNQDWFRGYIALSTIGQTATDLTVTFLQGSTPQPIKDVQFIIDATAIANDITKRVQARVSIDSKTWRPGYAVMANHICKDIKIDGTNDASISGHSYSTPLEGCPNGAGASLPPSFTVNPPAAIGVLGGGGGIPVGVLNPFLEAGSTTLPGTVSSGGGPAVISPIHANYEMGARITNLENIIPDRCTWQLFYVGDNKTDWPPIPISGYINSNICEALTVNTSLPSTDPNYIINNGTVKYFDFGPAGYSCDLTAPNDVYCGKDGWYTVEICAYEGPTKSKCEFRSTQYRPY